MSTSFHPAQTAKDCNLFETTIRVVRPLNRSRITLRSLNLSGSRLEYIRAGQVGGLLSTYALSSDKLFLTKAKELVVSMEPAFNTKSGVPFSDVNPRSGRAHPCAPSPCWR